MVDPVSDRPALWPLPAPAGPGGAARHEALQAFGRALGEALARLDAAEREAEAQAVALATGQTDDIAQVLLSGERARLALELAAAVRERAVESLKELLRTPL